MLCSEVWNFKAPKSNFSTQKCSPHESDHLNVVNNFVYNHLVSVVLPDTVKVPENLTETLHDCDHYKVNNAKISEFIGVEENFRDNFVHSASLYVLNIDTRIDCDSWEAVTPADQLIVSLNETTYQTWGLEGILSHFYSVTKDSYNDAETPARPISADAEP